MQARRLRHRARFERAPSAASLADRDAFGTPIDQTWTQIVTVWGNLREQPGREALLAGRLESGSAATLRVRRSKTVETVTSADRVVCRGKSWEIVSGPTAVDEGSRFVEFTLVTVAPD